MKSQGLKNLEKTPPDRNYQSEHFENFGFFKRVIRWVTEKRPFAKRFFFGILIISVFHSFQEVTKLRS